MESKIQLWYPDAKVVDPPLPTIGKYAKGYPRGAVVHYTAGAYGLSELEQARQQNMTYFLIAENGDVHQGFPLDRWGQHAGKSSYPGIEGNVSRHLVGIEVDCAGLLKTDGPAKFSTWWGKAMDLGEVRVVTARDNRHAGPYHVFTAKQEAALKALLLWLKSNNPDVFDFDLVVGHDEVAPTRKQDPGGSLSLTMPAFRSSLERAWSLQSLVLERQVLGTVPA